MTDEKKCEQTIDEHLDDRRGWLFPTIETLDDCKDIFDGVGRDYPEPDPYHMTRAQLIEALTDIGIECKDEETDETLRAAVIANIDDETIDGLDDWKQEAQETRSEEISDHVLSVDKKIVYSVCLSYGGPADYFELEWNGDGWDGGRYIYQDWFDGARRSINSSEAAEIAERLGIYPDQE